MSNTAVRPQRVLIAGGSRGIGLAIAEGFVRHGAQVSICARNAAGLAHAADALAAHGTPVHTLPCDLADATQIDAYVHAAAQALGGLDVVINNASGFGHGNDDASWQAGLDVDLMAAVRCNRAALPYLRRSAAAVILNISSINAQRPTPRAIAYSTAKAALDYYTTTLAAELARERIRVNAISPGSIEFPGGLWDKRSREEPELYARIRDSIPFGGFGQVQHVADAALFLASPQASWITGQVLAVDGGQSLGV
ncbi:SDR family oxidoreductase [Xanthomonas euvesicatoria pv. euvesicatoria]|uniref:Short chain dehydrogenase n=5 Tax=Xanthomonas TaxID=338 RepID=Q3BYH3_XANE5|nr:MULTISPECIES: SDR family NAD(P)-dependent oxidoreductase [Xanthomonas]OHX22865.1 3-oxoacyl-ACP reductase [Xanthomonas alfalfae]AOY68126.1 3-oxoacyl-ACP reductase [Xanthomonas euvesicatoria pv. vesicatoria str. 85-10]APO92091.1 3-oxoacyl-ACP reductase [Xanthomonas euvesicatoria]KHL63876.1 3-oxoacyl-ACP reductase [Xanthomonas euvesicatoria]KHL65314.1 3-oxoacyl-ACP reductase [Xanthomonas euvesicatoria]